VLLGLCEPRHPHDRRLAQPLGDLHCPGASLDRLGETAASVHAPARQINE